MAIIEEKINDNLVKRYSDKGLRIRQEQNRKIYEVAIDSVHSKFTYVETDKPIET